MPFPKRGGKLRTKMIATGIQNPALTDCIRLVKGVNQFTIYDPISDKLGYDIAADSRHGGRRP